MKTGQSVTVPSSLRNFPGARIYRIISKAELLADQEADRKAGNFFDSAGESILYSNERYDESVFGKTLKVVALRNVKHDYSWSHAPIRLLDEATGKEYNASRALFKGQ